MGSTSDRCDPISGRLRRSRREAMGFVGLFGIGCLITAWHWTHLSWELRAAELDGLATLPAISDETRASAGAYWPALGVLLLATGGLLGGAVFAGPLSRRLSRAAGWTLVVLAALHLVESALVRRALAADGDARGVGSVIALQAVAFFGYALLPISMFVALIGAGTALVRRFSRPYGAAAEPAERGAAGDDAHWRVGFSLPPGREPRPDSLGICLSGGGIRSATFALGALQALQRSPALDGDTGRSELTRAAYLAAVSGGAYTAGAFLLAVEAPRTDAGATRKGGTATPSGGGAGVGRGTSSDSGADRTGPDGGVGKGDGCTVPDGGADDRYELNFDHAFRPGSPEFDHLRRHGSYLADGLREWMVAVLVVLRGAIIASLCLSMLALLAGRWVGHVYHWAGRQSDLDNPWQPMWGGVFAVFGLAALATAVWILSLATWFPPRQRPWLDEVVTMTCVAIVIMIVVGAAIPVVTWASMRVVDASGNPRNVAFVGAIKGGMLGVAGVVTTVLGLLGRQRSDMVRMVRVGAVTALRRLGDIGARALQWIAVLSGLGMVLSVYLIIFGFSAWSTARVRPGTHPVMDWGSPDWRFPVSNLWLTVALTVLLLLFYFFVDETATGLHPFYRRRLATAFAVRRVRQRGRYVAQPYDWDEPTDLDQYTGRQVPGPQVIFCAATHCSDPEHTPPGRHVLPFTFSYDYIGGPEVGWCSPASLKCGPERISNRLAKDLTVQTAMAVSGAAFASASGSVETPANIILALTNARLGTWLPAPARANGVGPQWWWARAPRWRRMSYLMREIFALHPREFPMFFVTDGAHYESLGLVELLRHRCREIYCFDASNDTEAFARSLAQSITLAYDELGVEVTLDRPERAEPAMLRPPSPDGERSDGEQNHEERADGTGAPDGDEGPANPAREPERAIGGVAGAMAGRLAARLAQTPIISGWVTYPPLVTAAGGADQDRATEPTTEKAILVIGRAVLFPGVPWEIRQHAAAHPMFPQDATGDQWFDDEKFNAYTGLGNRVGEKAVRAMREMRERRVGRGVSGERAEDQLGNEAAAAVAAGRAAVSVQFGHGRQPVPGRPGTGA